jgi:hypothetical protein
MQKKLESPLNIPNQSQRTVLQHPQRLSQLAALAIVGQVLLLVSAWLLPLVSEFSLIGDHISELVLGRYGFVQTAAFLIAGLVHFQATYSGFPVAPIAFRRASRNLQSAIALGTTDCRIAIY